MVLSILPHFCPAYLLHKHTPPSITLRSNMPSIRAIEQMGCLEAKRSPCNRQNKTNKPTISKDLNSGLATTLEGIVCHHEAPFSSRGGRNIVIVMRG